MSNGFALCAKISFTLERFRKVSPKSISMELTMRMIFHSGVEQFDKCGRKFHH